MTAGDDRERFWYWWLGGSVILDIALAVFDIITGQWAWAGVQFVLAAVAAWWWNQIRKRRRKRRSRALAGAKSLARRAALVARQRAAQGHARPLLRQPTPGGAR